MGDASEEQQADVVIDDDHDEKLEPAEEASVGRAPRLRAVVDVLVVLAGGALIGLAALQQPYNQNEWVQVEPYGSDLRSAVSGTRQPPLDPLLGALVQRLVGVGQLEQRLVPLACGVGTLALVAVLVRRWRLGWGGTLGLVFLATAPLFVRYSAYARPYALPLFLMVACATVGTRWLETGRYRWLLLATALAAALPLARVPEPSVFLTTAAVALFAAGVVERWPLTRAWALCGALLLGLVTSGTLMLLALLSQSATSQGESLVDPLGVVDRFGPALTAARQTVLPLYAEWFPWWPLTLAVVGLALVVGSTRRMLARSWWWLPLVAGTLVFLVAFLLVVPEGLRDYRVRFAYFLTPAVAVVVAVVAHWGLSRPVWLRLPVLGLVAALVVSQLSLTRSVLTQDEAVDFRRAGSVLAAEVPDDALVVLDGPGAVGSWRQAFIGRSRGYLPADTQVVTANQLTRTRLQDLPRTAPVYLLVMDAACTSNVACTDPPDPAWDGEVAGYRVVSRMPHLVLYEPTSDETGLNGVLAAMTALVDAYGPAEAVPNAIVVARILDRRQRDDEAEAVLDRVCSAQPSEEEREVCDTVAKRRLRSSLRAPDAVSGKKVRRSPA
ncbi:hypothetical protein GCM10009623_29230 [Nocardioides aestuarii]|uniref:ArnT family glycosyltransferase n=1 Tax=Nocardioides aestuarii TaxID=252231 RepID=A0ABW4TQ40_9ACTN